MLEAFLSIGGTDGESERPLGKLTCALGQWTSVGGHFVPLQRIFDNVWRHYWLSQLGEGLSTIGI